MPKYRYAYNENEKIVDVLKLHREEQQELGMFFCIGCGNPLIAKIKGEKKVKHFAHKVKVKCNTETYLHKLAKQTFLTTYLNCLEENEPFKIELTHPHVCDKFIDIWDIKCDLGTFKKTYDLTEYYDEIKLEHRDDCFIPDLLLIDTTGEKESIYIEIAVTHFLSEEKEISSHRIIEISIEEEKDIDKITSRIISETSAKFVNFRPVSVSAPDAKCKCALQKYFCLIIYKSGKSFLEYETLAKLQFLWNDRREKIAYMKLYPRSFDSTNPAHDLIAKWDAKDIFIEMICEAKKRGFSVKNCFLCRYQGYNFSFSSSDPIYCKINKNTCNSNTAVDCQYFRYSYSTNPSHSE